MKGGTIVKFSSAELIAGTQGSRSNSVYHNARKIRAGQYREWRQGYGFQLTGTDYESV